MALRAENNEYTRIVAVDAERGRVKIETYASKAASDRGDRRFGAAEADSIHCGKLAGELDKPADGKMSRRENLIAAGYAALKNEPPFSDMEDVL